MIFGKKNDLKKCEDCGSRVNNRFSYCPHCGNSFIDPQEEQEDFGMLGRSDFSDAEMGFMSPQSFGITDRLISSLFNSMMKGFDKQFKNQFGNFDDGFGNAEIKSFPNGVRIKIFGPFEQKQKKKLKQDALLNANRSVGEAQLKKMSSLPRTKAKTSVKRIGDKIIYELSTPGIESTEDVFISKLESGYEVKAIGSKKVYVNSVPINLPLRKYSILDNKLFVEFNAGEAE